MSQSQQPDQDPTLSAFATPYHEYLQRLAQIWEETNKQIATAQRTFSEASTRGAQLRVEEFQSAHEKALGEYVSAIRGCWDQSQRSYSEAYANYLTALRTAWATAEPASMPPQVLAMVSQSTSAAAGHAATSIGNWSLIEHAGVPPHLLMAR